MSGQCMFPDLGTVCGLCSACDGTGRCQVKPSDDSQCGVIPCSGLSNTCRIYNDLTLARCASIGSCKTVSTATCTIYTDISCN